MRQSQRKKKTPNTPTDALSVELQLHEHHPLKFNEDRKGLPPRQLSH